MAEQQGTPPNAVKGGIVAYLCVEGAIKAGDFYKKAFAAEQVHVNPPDEQGRTMHVHLQINGGSVMLSDPYPEHGCGYVPAAGFSLMFPVKDVDTWYNRAIEAGCKPGMPPADMFWGDRYAQCKDGFGITWAFVGPKSAA
ncbi:MAG TPA: VOC family protein [Rhizomicrobium sp.]|nr:VOC family protein [Rhizomicrobium sp.]